MVTRTFVVAWGEFGPSIKDVSVLTQLPLFGDTHAMGVVLDREDQEKLDFLNKALSDQDILQIKQPTFLGFGTSRIRARPAHSR